MYPPFEFNNLLGPLIALGFFAASLKLILVLGFLKLYYRREEASYRD